MRSQRDRRVHSGRRGDHRGSDHAASAPARRLPQASRRAASAHASGTREPCADATARARARAPADHVRKQGGLASCAKRSTRSGHPSVASTTSTPALSPSVDGGAPASERSRRTRLGRLAALTVGRGRGPGRNTIRPAVIGLVARPLRAVPRHRRAALRFLGRRAHLRRYTPVARAGRAAERPARLVSSDERQGAVGP